MKLTQLTETKSTPCIVIDIQPEYTGINDGYELNWINSAMQFLNSQGKILMFVNADQDGLTNDTIADIKMYWEDSGFDHAKWNDTTIVDKGYGYLRSWMDEGVTPSAIITTIREMYSQHVYDSSMLFNGIDDAAYAKQMDKLGIQADVLDDAISVEWTSLSQLKRFSGAYLFGGGENECLREVTLLMNAFNIRYKMIRDFIY